MLVVVAGGALAFLFLKTRAVDTRALDDFALHMRRLAHADTGLNEDVLKRGLGLLRHFDDINRRWSEIHAVRAAIRVPAAFDAGQHAHLAAALAHVDAALLEKHALSERFKSDVAVLGTSLNYFPIAAPEAAAAAVAAGYPNIAVHCECLLLEVLRHHLDLDETRAAAIEATLLTLAGLAQDVPDALRARLDQVVMHARNIQRSLARVDQRMRDLTALPAAAAIERALGTFSAFSTVARGRGEGYRLALITLSALLLIAILCALLRLQQSAAALAAANESLERRVAQRTAALQQSNVELDREIQVRRQAEDALRRAKEEAEQHTQAKSQFLANMSHELRTPLNAIIGYSELLKEESEDGGQAHLIPDIDKIHAAGRHLLELINGVLDLSKIEAGRMELFLEEFAIAKMIDDVAVVVRPLVERNQNRLEVHCATDAGVMRSDLTKVRQVLFNLLSNASKFTKDGVIRLACARVVGDGAAERVRFTVQDTGIGMSEAQLAKVFDAFVQADSSTTRQFGGTGLGLTITREFCHLLCGTVQVQSAPGQGSTFTVTLPARGRVDGEADEADGADAGAQAEPHAGAHGRGVLVIDDDGAARDLIRRALQRDGFAVRTASNGEEGLRLAREQVPDAITLDVIMPGMDGWEVLTQLRTDARTADVPVIMLSIAGDPNLAFSLGASAFLTKPVERDRLNAVIDQCLAELGSGTVLVVDDDPVVIETSRRALEARGLRVAVANNGRVALEELQRSAPALVLLDLMMPEMDGFEFLAKLRADPAWRELSVVVMTAKTLTRADRERLNGRVLAILERDPHDPHQLLEDALGHIRLALRSAARSASSP